MDREVALLQGCKSDLEKYATGATAGRGKLLESGEIWGGYHGKLSYFPGFTKQNYLVFGEIFHFSSLGNKICMFCREMTHF